MKHRRIFSIQHAAANLYEILVLSVADKTKQSCSFRSLHSTFERYCIEIPFVDVFTTMVYLNLLTSFHVCFAQNWTQCLWQMFWKCQTSFLQAAEPSLCVDLRLNPHLPRSHVRLRFCKEVLCWPKLKLDVMQETIFNPMNTNAVPTRDELVITFIVRWIRIICAVLVNRINKWVDGKPNLLFTFIYLSTGLLESKWSTSSYIFSNLGFDMMGPKFRLGIYCASLGNSKDHAYCNT